MTSDINQRSSGIQSAEDKLTESIARFEMAIEKLGRKLEESNHKMQHVVEIAKHQKEELVDLKNTASEVVAPLLPYVHSASDYSRRMARSVKTNPKPYIWSAVGILGALCALAYFYKEEEFVTPSFPMEKKPSVPKPTKSSLDPGIHH
jgi:hypothetical protein